MQEIRQKRWFIPLLVIVLAILLALVLQFLVYDLVIAPIAYTWWLLKGFLQIVPQLAYWWMVVTMLFLAGIRALFRRLGPEKTPKADPVAQQGPVERMAFQMQRVKQGNYFKWAVANTLGELAHSILVERDGKDAVPIRRLQGPRWNPSPKVQAYLEMGLNSSFVQLPRKRFWSRPKKTALDIDINPVIDYLESQVDQAKN